MFVILVESVVLVSVVLVVECTSANIAPFFSFLSEFKKKKESFQRGPRKVKSQIPLSSLCKEVIMGKIAIFHFPFGLHFEFESDETKQDSAFIIF